MGEVWRAEQREPVRREVAVKLIRAGMEVPSVIARFEAERQALALMDHPSIPKVFAGGSTEQGSPYLVMEYVRGVPLDQHCDRARSSLRERIEIFRQVCAGVQHAHQRAILHRDLKPANVLVTLTDGMAQAKIVDFGIAKALVQPLTEKTMQTELGQVVGTVEYMSPEQADLTQQDIDTRSDVYSLGVMLYQLLSGVLPRSGPGRSQDVEPPPPSDRWVTGSEEGRALARARRSEPGLLRRQIAGDLDAIVMKALERERGRRYDSAAELSADLGRYLERQPVTARRSGPGSLMWRYLRRHRIGMAPVAGAVLLALHLGLSAGVLLQVRQSLSLRAASTAAAGRRLPVAAGQQGESGRASDGNPQRTAGHTHLLLAR
jgi:non-specific serine/threonine protein kinase/serine/threonine-protein kinase